MISNLKIVVITTQKCWIREEGRETEREEETFSRNSTTNRGRPPFLRVVYSREERKSLNIRDTILHLKNTEIYIEIKSKRGKRGHVPDRRERSKKSSVEAIDRETENSATGFFFTVYFFQIQIKKNGENAV